uniref:Glutaminyl-peptide cyclotransferase n=1 Tax=Strigamia maritima TaxID=126957 RepID=T1IPR2_STRMM
MIVFFQLILVLNCLPTVLNQLSRNYDLHHLSNQEIRNVLKIMKPDRFEQILDPILVPRVPGTKGHAEVRKFISDFLRNLSWTVEYDSFTSNTPFGKKNFTNIIATLDPTIERRVIVACHYDSKLNREMTFLMATDSAVPCAMILSLAEDLAKPLKNLKKRSDDLTLQLVFFDGEEAFKHWTQQDSLYGSRHLAALWGKKKSVKDNKINQLKTIDAFILLDLIGAPNPNFYNYFEETAVLFNRLVTIEKKLHGMNQLVNHRVPNQYFKPHFMRAGIEDDHTPFYKKGVPVLHLITVPFPDVWHKESDTKENLDFDVIRNLNKIFWSLMVEYLHLAQDNE